MSERAIAVPPGRHLDDDTGALVRDTVHRMGRRCRNWDYRGKGVYQITITLAERVVEATLADLPRQWPGVDLVDSRLMPDHVHFIVAVRARQKKPLGAIVGSFKSKSTSRWLDLLGRTRPSATEAAVDGGGAAETVRRSPSDSCASARAPKLWSAGYVDTILFDEAALANERAYLADNPRRLYEKLAHPELFTVLRDLPVKLGDFVGHFAAIGNHHLLKASTILQVQCSRRFFAYARDAKCEILKEAPPRVESAEFRDYSEMLLEEAAHGAVMVSPCISEGEREIARRAFASGHRVITLANKGFSPLYKPGGKLFDTCADGRLLMLAPVAWPYLPGEKKITRVDACILNRLAQLIAGSGAVEIVYRGVTPTHLDTLVRDSVTNKP